MANSSASISLMSSTAFARRQEALAAPHHVPLRHSGKEAHPAGPDFLGCQENEASEVAGVDFVDRHEEGRVPLIVVEPYEALCLMK